MCKHHGCLRAMLSALLIAGLFTPPVAAQSRAAAKTSAAVNSRPAVAAAAPNPLASASAPLPVRRVVLYKNGVGYFEHVGRVRGSEDVTVDFTSGQLNDVLKSLTVLDLAGGRITGVSYNSDAPLARRLGDLRIPLDGKTTVAKFLEGLRGSRVTVGSGPAALTGRVLSVERKTRATSISTVEVDFISLVTDAGEIRSVELNPSTSLRLSEPGLSEDVARYLALLASARQQDLRRMTIATSGSGERPLFVSYISETPVWKTTYRLVLPSKAGANPLLQGWAIVDNTVGQDWENVELSLVADAPQSFIQQLSQPYYMRRPVVALPEAAMLSPQTHLATLVPGVDQLAGVVMDPQGAVIPGATVRVYDSGSNLVAQTTSNESGQYAFNNLSTGEFRVEVEHTGFSKMVVTNVDLSAGGSLLLSNQLQLAGGNQTVNVTADFVTVNSSTAEMRLSPLSLGSGRNVGSGAKVSGAGVGYGSGAAVGGVSGSPSSSPQPPPPSSLIARMEAAARAQQLGDLFEYKLKEKVTIRKNQSALVPIVHSEIAAEKVSLWSAAQGAARPLRAVWLTNSSGLTLDGGSFSVLEDETFAGEGLTDPLKPGEKRLLSYAVDLSLLVDTARESDRQRTTAVRIVKGVMWMTSGEREIKTYTVRNEDAAPRTLILEHPRRPGWKLADTPAPAEEAPGLYRFRVTVPPKQTAKLVVAEVRPTETRVSISEIDDDKIKVYVAQKSINAEVEAALKPILEQKAAVAALDEKVESVEEEQTGIFDDQQRLRENLKSLKGSAEEKALTQRYTRQLDEQENRLEALRREIKELKTKRDAAHAELERRIEALNLSVSL